MTTETYLPKIIAAVLEEELVPIFEQASIGVAGAGIYPDLLRRMAKELRGE